MTENTLNENNPLLQPECVSSNAEEVRDKLGKMYFDFKDSMIRYSNIVKEEANKNPVLAILLGSVCLFSAIPLACFLIYCLIVSAVFLTIFIVVEAAALLVGLLVLAGFLFFTAMLGLGTGLIVAVIYTIFNVFNPRNVQKIE